MPRRLIHEDTHVRVWEITNTTGDKLGLDTEDKLARPLSAEAQALRAQLQEVTTILAIRSVLVAFFDLIARRINL